MTKKNFKKSKKINFCNFLNFKKALKNSKKTNFLIGIRGGSRIFSRGGGADFQKNFENFVDLFFFRSTKLIFRALLFWLNFLRRRQIFEKTVKKAVFGHFLKNFDKKIAFFWRAVPLKVSIYWRRRRL